MTTCLRHRTRQYGITHALLWKEVLEGRALTSADNGESGGVDGHAAMQQRVKDGDAGRPVLAGETRWRHFSSWQKEGNSDNAHHSAGIKPGPLSPLSASRGDRQPSEPKRKEVERPQLYHMRCWP